MRTNKNENKRSGINPDTCAVSEVTRGSQMGGMSTQIRCLGPANGREVVSFTEGVGDDFWIGLVGEEVCSSCTMPGLFEAYQKATKTLDGSEVFVEFPIHRNTDR